LYRYGVAMGLVTPDEWDRLAEVQAMGMPRFMTAQCWATELLGEAAAAGFFSPAAHASMIGKLSQLNSCAGVGGLYTFIRSLKAPAFAFSLLIACMAPGFKPLSL
jgi:hypothetical protein